MYEDRIDEELHKLAVDDLYTRVEILKKSAFERTELVTSESGHTFIRKYIRDGEGIGTQYGRLVTISSPHLPRLVNLYRMNDELVVILEYIEGPTLRERVGSAGTLSLDEALRVMEDVIDAVDTLHTKANPPIIHRDINPSNVILGRSGAVLIDLGIARGYKDGATRDTRILGTAGYAAPEQFGFGQSGVRTDVYALGMLLYFMLTGCDPESNLQAEIERTEMIPPALRDVISIAISLDADDRFASADALRNALRSAAGAVGDASTPSTAAPANVEAAVAAPVPANTRKFPRRSPLHIAAAIIATLVYVPFLVITLPLPWTAQPNPQPIDLVMNVISSWSIILVLFGVPYLMLIDPGHMTYRLPGFAAHRGLSILVVILISTVLSMSVVGVTYNLHSDQYKTLKQASVSNQSSASVSQGSSDTSGVTEGTR